MKRKLMLRIHRFVSFDAGLAQFKTGSDIPDVKLKAKRVTVLFLNTIHNYYLINYSIKYQIFIYIIKCFFINLDLAPR